MDHACCIPKEAAGNAEQHEEHMYDITNPLISLPPDALRSILCRVPACDHTSLWNSCKAFRGILDSDAYASERASTGWAEVTARLVPKEELYDRDYPDGPELYGDDNSYDPGDESDGGTEEEKAEKEAKKKRWEDKREAQREEDLKTYYSDLGHRDESYGYEDITIEIKVDGVLAGGVTLVLIPRPRYGHLFHEATDAHSQELQEVGWTLCNSKGRPKLRSIKEADVNGNARTGGFLHVNSVRIRQAYRPVDNTNIVACAVRAALTVPELNEKWSLASAMSDASVYMTKEEKGRRAEIQRVLWRNDTDADADADADADTDTSQAGEKKRLDDRWKECVTLDARTFLRVGFKQIPEVVGSKKDQPPWLFALPRFLEDPVLSHEAVAIKLHQPPDLPSDPTGVDKELLDIVKSASNARGREMDAIAFADRKLAELEQKMRESDETAVRVIGEFQELEAMAATLERQHEDNSQVLSEEQVSLMETTRAQIHAARSGINELKRKRDATNFEESITEQSNEINQLKEPVRERIRKSDEDVKTKVTALVNDKGASIRKSFALHCSARFHITEYIDLLLDLAPVNERIMAMNNIDSNGLTPLHCALMATPELSNADMYYDFVQHLLARGADKNIVDTFGRTPLGQYRLVICSRNNFSNAFDLAAVNAERGDTEEAWNPIHQRMERALMPIGGETDADRDAKDNDQADESSEDEEDFDEEGDY